MEDDFEYRFPFIGTSLNPETSPDEEAVLQGCRTNRGYAYAALEVPGHPMRLLITRKEAKRLRRALKAWLDHEKTLGAR